MAQFKVTIYEHIRYKHTGIIEADSAEAAADKAAESGYCAFNVRILEEGEGQKVLNTVVSIDQIYEGFMGDVNAKHCERCKLTDVNADDMWAHCPDCGNQLKFAEIYDGKPAKLYRYVDGGETIKAIRERSLKEHNAD